MKRVRIAILGESPCGQCTAACCKQHGHDFAVLLRGDAERRRFAPWASDVAIRRDDGGTLVERVLPYVSGRCQFLGADDRCEIYETRPGACREFQCVESFNADGIGRHGRFLQLNPNVSELLESI